MKPPPTIMGIFNATPDSFWEPSRYNSAVFTQEGFDIADIGACSTRPGAVPVSSALEWERLEKVLRPVSEGFVPGTRLKMSGKKLSIDTFRPQIVRQAYALLKREFIVNDVSGAAEAGMLETVRELGLEYVATAPVRAGEVMDFFEHLAPRLEGIGWILDPGFGFGKDDVQQNWDLLSNLGAFKKFGRPILVGVSMKRMTGGSLEITKKAHALALKGGASILRVHSLEEI